MSDYVGRAGGHALTNQSAVNRREEREGHVLQSQSVRSRREVGRRRKYHGTYVLEEERQGR
jgi:hypothetical protein